MSGATAPAGTALAPVAPGERIEALDVFRGFALLGVLIANMRGFSGPLAAYFDHSLMWQDPVSRAAQAFVDVFVSGKFITIFSFLFGIGFAIQIERAAARPPGFLLRRFGFLMALGLAHIYLFWWGDILLTYSVFGFGLLAFRNRQPRTLLWWAAGLYAWPLACFAGLALARAAGAAPPQPPLADAAELARVIEVYATGGYLEILRERAKEANTGLSFIPFFGPRLLGIFLLGMWVWRRGILHSLEGHAELLRRCRRWGLAAGLPLSLAAEAVMQTAKPNPAEASPASLAYFAITSVSMPAMSLFYLSWLAGLLGHPRWHGIVGRFAPVGRMALTNYLMQTAVCTLTFYGYGLGYFGKMGPLPGLGYALAVFAAQMALSRWWLGRWKQGPAEAAWRYVTYARWRAG